MLADESENNDTEAMESTYRLPASTSNEPSFVPRRRLPDNLPGRFPGLDPSPPASATAIPVSETSDLPSSSAPVFSMDHDHDLDLACFSQTLQPSLSNEDFEYSLNSRTLVNPPSFLYNIRFPLHAGWKSLDNAGGGPCLFRAGADHIWLRDFKILRRFVHAHIIEQWYFYGSFYTFPLYITIGSGNFAYQKTIHDTRNFHGFLQTEESMLAFNTSQAEIVALGNILNVDIFVLTYNLRNRDSSPEERTQWNEFPVNHGLAFENVFSRNTQEQLRILHEDDVHFTKLVWMPEPSTPEASIPSRSTESSTPTSSAYLTTSASSAEYLTPASSAESSTQATPAESSTPAASAETSTLATSAESSTPATSAESSTPTTSADSSAPPTPAKSSAPATSTESHTAEPQACGETITR